MARKTAMGRLKTLEKCPTGISGLDDVTGGGLPRGRPTLVCGGAGSGKTLLAMEFIVRGITAYGEPGVFMSFEETAEELATNVASLGFDLNGLIRSKKLGIDYVHIERSEIEETGDYDLEGLFIRLNTAIDEVGAKRVAIDSLEALFAGMPNEGILRAELRRLFRWLKKKGVTTIITGEMGDNRLTRHGLEEYVSDCVIFLDHRVHKQLATRRLRIVKYRGSLHGTNEYPALIDENGLSVLPITSLGLTYGVTSDRISTGIERLDTMMGGKGYYRGSSALVTGTAGTGKSSMAVAFADAACKRGERCMYFSFEESPDQIMRNMRSIGYDLQSWIKKDLMRFHSVRPTLYGLEMHLVEIHNLVKNYMPSVVVIDPVTNLTAIGEDEEIRAMLSRVIDFLKSEKITAFFTSLTSGSEAIEQSHVNISSLMDTWLLLRMVESEGERNRLLYLLKSRGMAHSNQMREFRLTDRGIELADVYVGRGRILTGSARLVQEAEDKELALTEKQDTERRRRELEHQQAGLRAEAETIAQRLKNLEEDLRLAETHDSRQKQASLKQRQELAAARKAD